MLIYANLCMPSPDPILFRSLCVIMRKVYLKFHLNLISRSGNKRTNEAKLHAEDEEKCEQEWLYPCS